LFGFRISFGLRVSDFGFRVRSPAPGPEEPSDAESEVVGRFLTAGHQHGTIGAVHYLAANITEHVRAQPAAQRRAGDHQVVAAFMDFAQDFFEHRPTSQTDLGCHS